METTEVCNPPASARKASHDNGALIVKDAKPRLRSKQEQQQLKRLKAANKAYGRGKGLANRDVRNIRDKKLRRNLSAQEKKYKEAALAAKEAEILLENDGGFLEPESSLERTYKVRQRDVVKEVAVSTAEKKFDLKLNQLGPYICDYTRNGREILLAGRKGHVATMDFRKGKLGCELQLGETIRDAIWLHNNQFFAVAQKRWTYMYDRNGQEIHNLKKFNETAYLSFLPYHFLLAGLSLDAHLRYLDTSTGQIVVEHHTRKGVPTALAQSPANAILHVGHGNGTVSLWSPNTGEALVKLLAHRGSIKSLAIDRAGRYMVSGGLDNKMAVWDIRMFKEVYNYYTRAPATSLAISDRGVTAVGWGTHVTMWNELWGAEKAQSPYLSWGGDGDTTERVRWCPFEDALGIGHSSGFSSLLVPGAGEPNFDALEANPFETTKQRQEAEVKSLLNKLPPETIALDPNFIGQLDLRNEAQRRADANENALATVTVAQKLRHRARGKDTALKKYLRKQRKRNIVDERKLQAEEMRKEMQEKRGQRREEAREKMGPALARFVRKD